MPQGLSVELLGGFRLLADGVEVRVPSRKARALLACVALAPEQSMPREQLATLLWEDSDQELARASLRQALASLRRALPEGAAGALLCTVESVALDPRSASSDVARLRHLLQDASPGALADLAGRQVGTLLEGFDAKSGAFESWIESHRRELRRELLQSLERAASRCLATGELPVAAEILARYASLEPSNERVQRTLIETLGRLGRYTEALRQYRLCRDALRRDLDVAPEPATEALHRELLKRRRATDVSGSGSPARQEELQTAADDGTRPSAAPDPPASATAAANRVATLREAVVLVARLCPSGRIANEPDPEMLRERWALAATRVADVIGRHGGRSERLAPGEAIAVFGLEHSSGHELEHALHAALELCVDRGADAPVFAVGIAQGQVLPATSAQPFPLDGTPVLEAREFARAADAAHCQVSEEIALQLGEHFEFAEAAAALSGRARRLRGVAGAAPAARRQRFAGRRAELAMLLTLLDRVVVAHRGRAVVVRGDAGIGKSALLEALVEAAARQDVAVHCVHVLDFGQPAHARPAPALAARLLGLDGEADDGDRRRAVDAATEVGDLASDDSLAALDLLGATPSAEEASLLESTDNALRERRRGRILHALLARAAARGPLLLLVEDVHWADSGEVGQLGDLAAGVATLPVLLALSTRSDDDPLNAAWRARARGCPVTMLDLAPLADDEARELAARFADLPPALIEQCLETAAGHPLFLEQLLRSARTGQQSLPGSVRALLLARIERLPPEAQRAVQAAAVLGERFATAALQHLLGDPDFDSAGLEAAGLLLRAGEECRFAHALIRTAVHASLLRSARRELHGRAADWYASRNPGLYADHLAAAEDPLAASAQLAAADLERRAHRFDRALAHAERALELAGDAPARFAARAMLGDVCLAKGRTEDAIAAYRGAIDLAAQREERVRALIGLATALRVVDRYDEALAALDRAEEGAIDGADPRQLAQLWTLRGNLHFPRGEFDACLRSHERALAQAERAGSTEDLARALGGLGDAQYQRGRLRTALAHFERCIESCDAHGIAGLRIAYLPMLAVTHSYHLQFDRAREFAAQAVAGAARAGDLRTELLANSTHASADCYQARYASSLASSARSLELARELGARRFEAEALVLQGLGETGLGRREAGVAALEAAVELARSSAQGYCGAWAIGALAVACTDPGRRRALLAEGEALLAGNAVSHNHLEFRMHAIDAVLGDGDVDAALRHAAALEAYTAAEPLPWAALVIARGRALAGLALGRAGASEAARSALRDIERSAFESQAGALRQALALR